MTAHMCKEFAPGCYRCDLGRDEAESSHLEDLREAATEARHNSFNGMNEWEDALADLFSAAVGAIDGDGLYLDHWSPLSLAVIELAQQRLMEGE